MKNTVIMTIGGSGVGKSAFGNCFLQKKAFDESDEPDSCTLKTNSECNIINGIKMHYIDTQGLNSSDGLDESNIQQMVDFLKNWKLGINVFFIVINIQDPRFNLSIQKMLILINDFYNNPNIWNQTGIIFTKCYKGHFQKEPFEKGHFQSKVKEFIKSLNNCSGINPQIPCFFVDSCDYKNDESTQSELDRLYKFVDQYDPIQTNNFVAVKPQYKSIEELFGTKCTGYRSTTFIGRRAKMKCIQHLKIFKYIHWNGNVTYSEPILCFTEEEGPYFY